MRQWKRTDGLIYVNIDKKEMAIFKRLKYSDSNKLSEEDRDNINDISKKYNSVDLMTIEKIDYWKKSKQSQYQPQIL